MRLALAPYDLSFLDLSWTWLHDDEIKHLTMTPDFTRKEQHAFFASLADRTDYHIWGVRLVTGRPVGVAGIKNVRQGKGEYWGYLGEKDCWGQGLGREMLELIETEACKLGVSSLELVVAPYNDRAIALYRSAGYQDIGSSAAVRMEKRLSCP